MEVPKHTRILICIYVFVCVCIQTMYMTRWDKHFVGASARRGIDSRPCQTKIVAKLIALVPPLYLVFIIKYVEPGLVSSWFPIGMT